MTVTVTDQASRAAVLGRPVAHSLSPLLHRAAYDALGLRGWSYDARDVGEGELAGVLARCEAEGGWAGVSLTMPLKDVVVPLLDEVDATAREVGACNTMLWDGARRIGVNTDVHGIVAAVRECSAPQADRPLGTAHVLGAGATAASAVVALARLGHRRPRLHLRDPARAGAVLAAAARCGSDVTLLPWPVDRESAAGLAGAAVVVSTVPAGAADPVADLLPGPSEAAQPSYGTLLDVAYDPWPSRLAAAWSAAGGRVAPGSLMLLHQAGEQVRLMTGREAPLSAMRVALAAVRVEITSTA